MDVCLSGLQAERLSWQLAAAGYFHSFPSNSLDAPMDDAKIGRLISHFYTFTPTKSLEHHQQRYTKTRHMPL